jgi:hypothetical protein
MDTWPGVPPVVFLLNKMTLDVVTALDVTVTAPGEPDMAPETPTEALEGVAALILIFEAAPFRFKFPTVATKFPAVAVTSPAVAVTPPVVAITPVPDVTVVPAAKLVVVVKEPGVVIAEGRDTVATPATVLTLTWPAVPLIAIISPELLAN